MRNLAGFGRLAHTRTLPRRSTALKVDKDTDYSKLRVKELRKILDNRGVGCDGCLEKGDYVRKCQETEHLEL